MNQSERRQILIRSLLKERSEYHKIEIPHNGIEQKKLLRSLMNIRMAAPVWNWQIRIRYTVSLFAVFPQECLCFAMKRLGKLPYRL